MKKIITLGGSNSSKSINKKLAVYTANQIKDAEIIIIDLNEYSMPMYGIDYETEHGYPEAAKTITKLIESADGIVISLSEHNGCYSAVFKNTYDWLSRINKEVWANKPMFLLSTSPGKRGGATVMQIAKAGFPFLGGNIISDFSLPSFYDNFTDNGISDEALRISFEQKLERFKNEL